MAHLGYKNIAFRKYKEEQEKIRMWKKAEAKKRKDLRIWIRANESKKKRLKDRCYVSTVAILQLVIVALLIVFYGIFAMSVMAAETKKFGDGPFVMAVSYTDYKHLQYVGNFPTCVEAEAYYYANCTDAPIMMCQAEARMYMPLNHDADNTFSTFDFEVNESQSCGFVKTQAGYSTFVEED